MTKRKERFKINPFLLVILSFIIVILIGAILLCMPWANVWGKWLWNIELENGQHFTFIDSLLTAVSATCVTGVNTYRQGFADSLTWGGQFVVLTMIQIGGLGFITILTFLVTLFKTKLEFKNRFIISQMLNGSNFANIIEYVRRIILISIIFEGIGVLLGLPVFLTMYPNNIFKALWNCLFHSVSAFNNAGFDLFGGSTFSFVGGLSANGAIMIGTDSWLYYYFCIYVMLLIFAGGISFLVIIEIATKRSKLYSYRPFSKICILMSFVLLIIGAVLFYFSDGLKGQNSMSFFQCIFQSVTCRTAGFVTYDPGDLSLFGKFLSMILMFIGGAPLGTAGGIKTVTIFVVGLAIFSYLKGRKVSAFHRTYSEKMILKSMSLTFIAIIIILVAFLSISAFGFENGYTYDQVRDKMNASNPNGPSLGQTEYFTALFYEIFSCFSNTGFCLGFESYFSTGTKIVLCLLMFLGRLGPMTFFQLFEKNIDKEDSKHYSMVEEDFLVG